MEYLNIDHLETRYHLTSSRRHEVNRLDRVLSHVLDEFLEPALKRTGIPSHQEICIRTINVPVRLRLGATDRAMALAWSLALAETIQRAVEQGNTEWVVSYPSRVQGLIDFAAGVARRDLSRDWAWRQLGFARFTSGQSMSEVVRDLYRALQREAILIVPVLSCLAEAGYLSRLVPVFNPEWWVALAREALQAAGAVPAISALNDTSRQDLTGSSPEAFRALRSALETSFMARCVVGSRERGLRRQSTRLAFAALALLETESVMLRRSDPDAGSVLNEAAEILAAMTAAGQITARSSGGPAAAAKSAREHRDDLKLGDGTVPGTGLQHPDSIQLQQTQRRTRSQVHGENDLDEGQTVNREGLAAPGRSRIDDSHGRFRAVDTVDTQWAADSGGTDDFFPAAVRRRGFTNMGGLLFLIGVLEDLGIPDEIAASEFFKERSFRWVLIRLGCLLTTLQARDPAVLAFAGLSPTSRHYAEADSPIEEPEMDVLNFWKRRIAGYLRERLGWQKMSDSMILDRVCRRRARVVADPGWIEVHLSLEEVSTDLRKAGLDLDPGYIQWIGVVLKFFYE